MWMPWTVLCRSRWSLDSVFCGTCPAPYVCDLQSRMARQVPRMPWHPVPRRAALVVLAGRCFDLQSADWCCNLRLTYQTAFGLYPLLFYKESTLFLGFYSGFTSGEYHVIRVDFIVALRRTKGRGRRTLRSPPSPSSGLHLIHPGLSAAAGWMLAAAVDRDLVSLYPVQTVYPHFDVSFGCYVFGSVSFAFQSGCWAGIARFSLLGGWAVRACGYIGFWLYSFVGFALTAIGLFVWIGNGMAISVSLVA